MTEPQVGGSSPQQSGVPRSSYERVMAAAQANGSQVKRAGGGVLVQCPVHGDQNPSLSVGWKDDPHRGGKTVLHCHAGCRVEDIAAAWGLAMADLFDAPLAPIERRGWSSPSRTQRQGGARRGRLGPLPQRLTTDADAAESNCPGRFEKVATYRYCTADGKLTQEVYREECRHNDGTYHKRFRQAFIDAAGRLVNTKPANFTPVPYRLPELLQGIADDRKVWILEGEKDVATAEELGLVATTNAGGAGNFPMDWIQSFLDASVAICLDRDAGGYRRGVLLSEALRGVADNVQLLLPAVEAAKSDFTDHVAAGHRLEQFVSVSAEELTARIAAADVEQEADKLLIAHDETYAHSVEAGRTDLPRSKQTTHSRHAQRWALETERLYESILDSLARCYTAADLAPSAHVIALAASHVAQRAQDEAIDAHELANLPLPQVLRAHDLQTPPGSERKISSTATASEDELPSMDELVSGEPIFRIVEGEIKMWEKKRRTASRQRSEEEGDDQDELKEGRWKRLLSVAPVVIAREFAEAEQPLEAEEELLGRASSGFRQTEIEELPSLVAYHVEFRHPSTGELLEIRVPAEKWDDHSWLARLPGRPDYDHKRAGLDLLQRAILAVSTEAIDTVLIRSTGWHQIDGEWRFIHRRGGIGPHGHVDMRVRLTGPLFRYDLPDPINDVEQLGKMWRSVVWEMCERFPDRLMFPLFGHMWRSMMRLDHASVLVLQGPPASYKTSLAEKVMHCAGERWGRRSPGSSASGNGSTSNALRLMLNRAADLPFWVDDFSPTPSLSKSQDRLQEYSRMVFNSEDRDRLQREGQDINSGSGARGTGLFTSEVMPRAGTSGGTRMLALPLQKGDLDRDYLFGLDSRESRYARAGVTSSWLQWYANDHLEKRLYYRDLADQEQATFVETFNGSTDRESEFVGQFLAGWHAMTDFLVEVEVLSEDEQEAVLNRARRAMGSAVEMSTNPDIPTTTSSRIRELIAYALGQGLAYVEDHRTGQCPEWPVARQLGWRLEKLTDSPTGEKRLQHGRTFLGWVNTNPQPGERQQRVIMCDGPQLDAVIKEASATQSEKVDIDLSTVATELQAADILLSEGADRRHKKVRCSVPCAGFKGRRMYVLDLDRILGGDDPDDDGQPALPDGPNDPCGGDGNDETPEGPTESADEEVSPQLAAQPDLMGDADGGVSSAPAACELNEKEVEMTAPGTNPAVVLDWNGVPGYVFRAGRTHDCDLCGKPCDTLINEFVAHPECWRTSYSDDTTTAGAQTAAVAATAPTSTEPAAVSDPQESEQPATAVQDRPAAPATPKSQPSKTTKPASTKPARQTADGPRAAAAILDVDRIWLSNGEQLSWPTPPQHLGDAIDLAYQLDLGTKSTSWRRESGQIWITDALAQQWGIDVDQIRTASLTDVKQLTRDLTKSATGIRKALEAGYQFGSEGDSLNPWNRVWKPGSDTVWVVLICALPRQEDVLPLIANDPEPAELARRIGLFADKVGFPFYMSAQATGTDLMKVLRWKDRGLLFRVHQPPEPALLHGLEMDEDWSRIPTEEERQHQWVHSYDRGGSYLAAAHVDMGVGDPEHHPSGCEFNPKLPGLWKVRVPEAESDWRMPNLLGFAVAEDGGREVWVATPTLEFAAERDYLPEIVEAYTWAAKSRILEPWYERMRDARTALDDPADAAATFARAQLKAVYTRALGQMAASHLAEEERAGVADIYAPERYALIRSKARVNILRRVRAIGESTGRWPVAINRDSVLYTSNDRDPVAAWPGGEKWYGRGLGKYKYEGSDTMADHEQFLTGHGYRGKAHLKKLES